MISEYCLSVYLYPSLSLYIYIYIYIYIYMCVCVCVCNIYLPPGFWFYFWIWRYQISTFWHVYFSFLYAFKNVCVLSFISFLLLSKDAFFILIFLLFTIDSQESRHVAFGLLGMYPVDTSVWVVTNFSWSSFGVCLSDVSWRVPNLFLTHKVYWWLISLLAMKDSVIGR